MKRRKLTRLEQINAWYKSNPTLKEQYNKEFQAALKAGMKPVCFTTLTYKPKYRYDDRGQLISPELARDHLVRFANYVSRQTQTHLELFAAFDTSGRGSDKFPHIHLIVLTNKTFTEDERREFIATFDDAWREQELTYFKNGRVKGSKWVKRSEDTKNKDGSWSYGITSRPWNPEQEDECLAYLYYGHRHILKTTLFCGQKGHARKCIDVVFCKQRRGAV